MNTIMDNWYILVAFALALGVVVTGVYSFFKSPSEVQQAKVKEWLIWACIEAEKALQSGTGQLKLRKVYDAFIAIPSFSWIARIITFETFSEWVTEALRSAKIMIVNNSELAKYVYGDKAVEQVAKLKSQLGL